MSQLTIMEKVAHFFEDKHEQTLFTGLGKQPLIMNHWFYARDIRTWKEEKLHVYQDLEDPLRIRCKGKEFAFSLHQDATKQYYVDHLLLGDIEKENFSFSMRRNKELLPISSSQPLQEVNSFVIKQKEKKDMRVFQIQPDSLDIHILSTDESVENFHFEKDEKGQMHTNLTKQKDFQKAHQTFLDLERKYPTITGYVSPIMPIIEDTIKFCNTYKIPEKMYIPKHHEATSLQAPVKIKKKEA